jgi:hypothetical protein
VAARKQLERARDLADDVDWAKVSDEYAFQLAERLADWLASSDCPAPLVRWFAGAVDRAEYDPRKFLAELGFTAEKRRPRAGVAWTARMVGQLVSRGYTQSAAIELLVDATYSARHPVSKRTIESYLRKHLADEKRDTRQRAIIAALRAKPPRKKSRKQ